MNPQNEIKGRAPSRIDLQAVNASQVLQARVVRRIIRAFIADESAFMAAATAAGWEEPIEEVQERFLRMVPAPEFEPFFKFLSRRAPDLISPCHWLVLGPRLDLGRETKVPTLGELLRLIQLVRERRPELLDFTRQLISGSVLREVVRVEPAVPTKRPVETCSATGAVA
jgi:hypothetical protein